MLIIPSQEHGRSSHFLISSSISFFKDLKFLSYRFFTCLVRVTPRCLILFMAAVKGNVSLISFSVHLSFVCSGMLILFFLVHLLFCHINNCRSFLVEFLASLMYTITSSANSDFDFFLYNLYPLDFLLFLCCSS